MRLIPFFLLFWMGAAPLATTAAQADTSATYIDRAAIDELVAEMAAEGFVGVLGISDAHATIFVRGIGTTGPSNRPYGEATIVDIASISKQFTGAAILSLVEQGKLALTDRLDTFFPDVPKDKQAITLHHLLTHTAGFPDGIGRDEEAISRGAYLARAFAAPLVGTPGDSYHYSNVGYSVLAAVIEIASGERFETYLFQTLWRETGMFETGYHRPDWRHRDIPELDAPYKGLSSQLELLTKNQDSAWHLYGNGGILSSVQDMLAWHRALLGDTVLSPGSKNLLMAPHVPEHDAGFYHYGYGWSVVPDFPGGKLVWHNGGSYFSRAEFWRFPDTGLGFFIATHRRDVDPALLAEKLARLLQQPQSN